MQTEDAGKSRARFLLGVSLTWIPFLLVMAPAIVQFVRQLSPSKTTGVGAIAGGLSEGFVVLGFATMLASQIAAVVLLSRAFAGGRALRGLASVLSICCSLLVLTAVVAWLLIVHRHGATG